jgi:hypothetical protein
MLARQRLGDKFIAVLAADFEEHGAETIVKLRETEPAKYAQICANLMGGLPNQLYRESGGEAHQHDGCDYHGDQVNGPRLVAFTHKATCPARLSSRYMWRCIAEPPSAQHADDLARLHRGEKLTRLSARRFLVVGAYRRSGTKRLVIVHDPEHYLLGRFVVHLLGQDAGFFGPPTIIFWVVEMRDIGHEGASFARIIHPKLRKRDSQLTAESPSIEPHPA